MSSYDSNYDACKKYRATRGIKQVHIHEDLHAYLKSKPWGMVETSQRLGYALKDNDILKNAPRFIN